MFFMTFAISFLSVLGLAFVADSFRKDIAISFKGQTKTNTLSDGSGGKAQTLKDKPRAFNPFGAIAKAAGPVGVVAGVAEKILPGAAGLAFKGAKLGVNAAKMAGGGLAAVPEALNKATGLTRKISGFVKPIGQKVRFKANSVTGFLKDQLETEGDRLRNRFRENKQIISNNLPSGFKRGIKGINNGIKAGASFTRNKARTTLEEMKENREEWNRTKREMARNFKRRRAMIASALQDTSGYKVFREGLDGFKREVFGPANLPKKSVFHAKYGKNSLSYQESEDSNKFMNYTQMKNLLESEYVKAALSKEDRRKLENQMNADYKTHGNDMRYSLSPEYKERIRKTKEMLNSSYGKKYQEAFMIANQENDKVAIDTVGNFLGKNANNQFHGLLENHIKDLLGPNASRPAIQKKRQEILNEIANDTDGVRARMFLSDSDREKLKKEIAENQDNNTRSHILAISAELTREYKKENPSISDNDANTRVINASAEIIESLTRLQQSTPRTEVVTNTTQTQVVQAVQTAGDTANTANNTVVNTTTVNNNVQNNATNNVTNNATGASTTASSASNTSSTSSSTSNSSGNNTNISSAENAKIVHTTVVQKSSASSPSLDVNKLTKDISEGLRAGITKDVTKNMNAFITGFMDNFKDGTLKDLENAIKENGSMREVYKLVGDGNEVEGRRRYKELMKRNGTVDELYGMIKKEQEYEPITNITQYKKGRGRKRATSNDDVA